MLIFVENYKKDRDAANIFVKKHTHELFTVTILKELKIIRGIEKSFQKKHWKRVANKDDFKNSIT